MKRILCLLAILLSCITGWSQTMTIDFKDGTTQKISMNDINAITFTQDNDANTEVSIVGIWECTHFDLDSDFPREAFKDEIEVGENVHFNSDGTFSRKERTGRWKLNGNTLNFIADAEYAIPVDYKIEKLTSTELELSGNFLIAQVFIKFKRVS